jgi:hypothetical protein
MKEEVLIAAFAGPWLPGSLPILSLKTLAVLPAAEPTAEIFQAANLGN